MAETALEVRDLCKSFWVPRVFAGSTDPRRRPGRWRDRLNVLSGVSFEVPHGQTLGIIGANGSGKTTLLKILAGVMQPDSGGFVADGRVGALLELGAGFHPELTGLENVHLNGALLGLPRRHTQSQLAEIIEFCELERSMDLPVKHYSSGMTVRLGFAIAAQLEPEILLLDETFAVGDAHFQNKALSRVKALKAAGATQLLVSHNEDLLLEMTERVLWLDGGRVEAIGKPDEILTLYRRKCGALLSMGDRVSGRSFADPAMLAPPADFRAPIRLLGARLANRTQSGGPIELESTETLTVETGIEADPGVQIENYALYCLFTRDDRRTLARARIELGEGMRGPFSLAFDPITLAFGEYEVTLLVTPREEGLGGAIQSLVIAPQRLKIRTPLPYEFRLAARIEGIWETPEANRP